MDDYGSTLETADQFEIGDVVSGALEEALDQDWFAVELQQGVTYSFDFEKNAGPYGFLGQTNILLRDIDGDLLLWTGENSSGETMLRYQAEYTGVHYFQVLEVAERSGSYTITSNQVPDLPDLENLIGYVQIPTGEREITPGGIAPVRGTIANSGVVDATDVRVDFMLVPDGGSLADATFLESREFALVPIYSPNSPGPLGGASIDFDLRVPESLRDGSRLAIVIDPDNEIAELDETNNVLITDPLPVAEPELDWLGTEGADSLEANNHNDTLQALGGDDVIDGQEGDDIIYGGDGDDHLTDGRGDDLIYGGAGNDTLVFDGGVSEFFGDAGNDTFLPSLDPASGRVTVVGGAGNDTLTGWGADMRLRYTGDRDDYLVTWDEASDYYTVEDRREGSPDGVDHVAGVSRWIFADLSSLGGQFEPRTFFGDNRNSHFTGNYGNDEAYGGSGNEAFSGSSGDDTLFGGEGNDRLLGASGWDVISGGSGNDTIDGGTGHDSLDGGADVDLVSFRYSGPSSETDGVQLGATVNLGLSGAQVTGYGNDTITNFENAEGTDFADDLTGDGGANNINGLAGNDTLNGGAGSDTMDGGAGDDRFFVDSTGDVVIEAFGEGRDTLTTSVDYVLPDNVEIGSMSGSGNIGLTGNALANTITGNTGNNEILGLGGADRLRGRAGNDTLEGGEGNDILEGQAGANRFVFGPDNGDDQVRDWQPGIDLLDFDSLLGLRFADLRITASGNEALISFDDPAGSTGSVRLTGIDPESIEIDILSDPDGPGDVPLLAGTSAGENLAGSALAEDLIGLAGNDALNGRAGDDTMLGGFGDDRYFLDDAGDLAIEFAFQGIDQVDTRFSMVLPDHVERGAVRGGGAVDITGNDLDNFITGSDLENVLIGGDGRDRLIAWAGNDTLDGGLDRDVLEGGAGSDVFVFGPDSGVDLITDFVVGEDLIDMTAFGIAFADITIVDGLLGALVIFDASPGSVDLVTVQGVAASDLRLASFIGGPILPIVGTPDNDVLFGTIEDDELQGLGGNDQVNGLAGADTMIGGPGDDRYFVDNPGDVVTELPREGTDLVTTSIDLTLSANVENANTNTTDPVNLTGNGLNNVLNGNDAANTLAGLAGDDDLQSKAGIDVIIGGTGADLLRGGTEADTFVFGTGDGQGIGDTIIDFEVGIDKIDLSTTGLNFGDLTIQDAGANATIAYGTDLITVFNTTAAQLDVNQFHLGVRFLAGDFSGEIIEDSATPVLSAMGRIAYSDHDPNATHTVIVQSVSSTHGSFNGILSAEIVDESTGDRSGEIEWQYSMNNEDAQFLSSEIGATETFLVAVLDDVGDYDYRYIQIAMVGEDDDASIEGSAFGTVFEDGNVLHSQKLRSADAASYEGFGWSTAISADASTVIVGKPGDDSFGGGSGSAELFDQAYNSIAVLLPLDISAGDRFGISTAISRDGQIIAVGATGDDDNGGESGSVYVFDRSGNELSKLTPLDGASSDNFGTSVAISGDGSLIVVGAPQDDENGLGSGSAYLFDQSGQQIAKITAQDGSSYDRFGLSAAVSGTGEIIAIGAPQDDDADYDSGSVYLFDSTGTQLVKLVPEDGARRDWFGSSISMSDDGSTIVVGADDGNSAYIFDQAGTQLAKLTPPDGYLVDEFGWSTSVSDDGSIIVVTARTDYERGIDEGSAYVFDGAGVLLAKLTAADARRDDGFGISASISGDGDKIVVGASFDDDHGFDSGTVYTFERNEDGYWVDFAGNIFGPAGTIGSQSLDLKQAFGTLSVLDVDAGQAVFLPVDPGTPGDNAYGTFEMASDGNWQYILDNELSAIQDLDAGELLYDSILVHSLDGTASQQILIEITGSDEELPEAYTAAAQLIPDQFDFGP